MWDSNCVERSCLSCKCVGNAPTPPPPPIVAYINHYVTEVQVIHFMIYWHLTLSWIILFLEGKGVYISSASHAHVEIEAGISREMHVRFNNPKMHINSACSCQLPPSSSMVPASQGRMFDSYLNESMHIVSEFFSTVPGFECDMCMTSTRDIFTHFMFIHLAKSRDIMHYDLGV